MTDRPQEDSPPADGIPGGEHSTFRLLARVREGDHAALESLFSRYVLPLRRWASGRLPRYARDAVDTQDLVQETLLRTFKKIESFKPEREGALQAYLRQALLNRIRDELRRHRRRPIAEAIESEMPDPGASALDEAIGSEAVERYEAALSRLKPEDREAIIARVEMGCSYDDLALALGKSVPAARKTAQRAVLKLAREMNRVSE